MKDRKTRIELFDFFDYRGIERHLEKMASKGWLLEKMGVFRWTYRRIEPQKLNFSVYYYSKVKGNFLYDPVNHEEFRDFQELCEHTGWKLAACRDEMQIFYNETENPLPIETDLRLKIENVNKSSTKYINSSYLVIALFMIKEFFLALKSSPVYAWSYSGYMKIMIFGIVLFLLALSRNIYYFQWKRRALRDIEDGKESEPGFAETKKFTYFRRAFACYFTLLFVWLICLIAQDFTDSLKTEMIEVDERVWQTVYHDEVPVGLEDMMELDMEEYSSSNSSDETPFLAHYQVSQYPWNYLNDSGVPTFYYDLVIVKAPFLYEACREEMFHTYDDEIYEPVEMPEWGADEVYRLKDSENELLIFSGNRILKINSSWELTPEQIKLIRQKLILGKL